jgi:transcriptional regulator with XRE-family HTH domain
MTKKNDPLRKPGRPKNDPGFRWDFHHFRIVRLTKGWTLQRLTDKIGISTGTISRWQKSPDEGGYVPTPEQAELVATAMGVQVREFDADRGKKVQL